MKLYRREHDSVDVLALSDFLLFYFPCSADHKRDGPPYKVVFRLIKYCMFNVRKQRFDTIFPPDGVDAQKI